MAKLWLEPFSFPLPTLLLYLPSHQEQDPPWTCFMLIEKVDFSLSTVTLCCIFRVSFGVSNTSSMVSKQEHAEMYFMLQPLLVMFQDNFLYADTSHLHHLCDLDPFSTTAVSKSSCGSLLWTLILNPCHVFSTGVKSGDWRGHVSSFISFLWTQRSYASCWNAHPSPSTSCYLAADFYV